MGFWLLLSLLCVTIPAVIGHFFKVLEHAVKEPDSDELPDFGGHLVEYWKAGLSRTLRLAIPWLLTFGLCASMFWLGEYLTIVPAARKHWSGPQFMAILGFLGLNAATAYFNPAIILQVYRSPRWSSTLRLGELLRIARSGGTGYVPLGVFAPLVWIAMAMLAMTGIGALAVPPVTVLASLALARWLGLYHREYLTDQIDPTCS
jgi:hypothetical protein